VPYRVGNVLWVFIALSSPHSLLATGIRGWHKSLVSYKEENHG
jgi:hypothetical protein